nr:tryptophan synthase subunit alpha [Kibdelosporangium sp. MJ126-NF4]CEL17238.1 Tryptophan synthase alpha chain [Kibdelosporangium sp. MJ126-NF4]CTQ91532.1 Tryptophan synthase alpha chain (EC 4.2.1.20) [Kibdelosporangium sp. MJ126-NF4]
MAEFFDQTADGEPGLALFLNAGDPPLDVLADLVFMLDDAGVDCLELAVPFPGSVTDGPVIRRSHERALALGVGLDEVLTFISNVRPKLHRLRIALLADWSYSIKSRPMAEVVGDIADAGADGLLLHAVPPRVRPGYYQATKDAGLPVVATCYHKVSTQQVMAEATEHATAYLYLVAQYGRSGTAPVDGYADLAGTIAELRLDTHVPIAVGFGVKTRADVTTVHALGADAVIVGSAGVARVEEALAYSRDVVKEFADFVRSVHPAHTLGRLRS